MDTDAVEKVDRHGGSHYCGPVCKSIRMAPGLLPVRSGIQAEAEYLARAGVGFCRLPRYAGQDGADTNSWPAPGLVVSQSTLVSWRNSDSAIRFVQRADVYKIFSPARDCCGAGDGEAAGLFSALSSRRRNASRKRGCAARCG